MRILITYATTEGQTKKIARFVFSKLKALGHTVSMQDASGYLNGLRPEEFDANILAGSVHEDRHQDILNLFVAAHRNALEESRTLFLSVSLSAAFESSAHIAQRYVDEFCQSLDWRPDACLLVPGAIKPSAYGYYEEMIMQHRVLPKRPVERPEEEQEFTDWAKLEEAAADFAPAADA
jgi:menaquinone-dependent protoporphyrinogen oxidase